MIFKKSDNKDIKEKPVKIAIGKILDQSFSFLFNQGLWFIAFGILWSLPYLVPFLYESFTETQGSVSEAYFKIVNLIERLMVMFLIAMLTLACRDWHSKSKISWMTLFCEAGQQFPRILGCSLLFGLFVGFSSILLIIPGFMVAMSYICILPVLLIERLPIFESFTRCGKLTKGNRWRIFGLVIVSYFIMLAITACLFLVKDFLLNWEDERTTSLLASLITPLLYALFGLPQAFLYYDLREKKEGLDLEMLSAQIERLEPAAI